MIFLLHRSFTVNTHDALMHLPGERIMIRALTTTIAFLGVHLHSPTGSHAISLWRYRREPLDYILFLDRSILLPPLKRAYRFIYNIKSAGFHYSRHVVDSASAHGHKEEEGRIPKQPKKELVSRCITRSYSPSTIYDLHIGKRAILPHADRP